MIYRNGWREFILMTLGFGTPFGLMYILRYDLPTGLIAGGAAGLMFGGLMTLFSRGLERKFRKTRAEITADRRIICEGGTTWQGIGGWMFLTEAGLEFYPHKINHARKDFAIPLEELAEAGIRRNFLVIKLKDGTGLEVAVSKNKEWKKQIDAVLTDRAGGNGYSV